MIKIFKCRRSSLALIGIFLLFLLGYTKSADVTASMATIIMAIAGANAYEAVKKNEPKA